MARGVNKIMLIGNVGQKYDVKEFTDGGKAINFTLATQFEYRSKASGEYVKGTEWHSISCTGAIADIVSKWVQVGDKLYVEGTLRSRMTKNKSGVEIKVLDVLANTIEMLSSPKKTQTEPLNYANAKANIEFDNKFEDDLPF